MTQFNEIEGIKADKRAAKIESDAKASKDRLE